MPVTFPNMVPPMWDMTINDLTVRPAAPQDADFLRTLFMAVQRPSFAAVPLSDAQLTQMLDMQYQAQTQSHAAAHPDAVDHLLLKGKMSVGRLSAKRTAAGIHLIDFAIVPDHQAKGIGTSVLKAVCAHAHEQGHGITLQVFKGNSAQRLYQRLGFKPFADADPYLKMILPAP